jgi:hypothetical protein
MSQMNIVNMGMGKGSKRDMQSKSSSPSRSKSPTKVGSSLTKIEVIEEVPETRSGGNHTSTTNDR